VKVPDIIAAMMPEGALESTKTQYVAGKIIGDTGIIFSRDFT